MSFIIKRYTNLRLYLYKSAMRPFAKLLRILVIITCSVAPTGRRYGAAETVQFLGEFVQFAGQPVQPWRWLVWRVERATRAAHVAVRPASARRQVAADGRRRRRALDERQKEVSIELVGHVGRVEVDVHEAPEAVVVDRLQQRTRRPTCDHTSAWRSPSRGRGFRLPQLR